ncbi:MAG: hypothetical protein M3Y87_08595 [Myxococcota bacterium]|nr:hypothetical protein [Myxococcota bacterium]
MYTRHPTLLFGSLFALSIAIAGCKGGGPGGGDGTSTETCIPGETLILGCASACAIGSCAGSGSIRVCDGILDVTGCRGTTDTAAFVSVSGNDCGGDDSCPRGRLVCPGSGSITIVPRPQSSFSEFTCEWELEHRGILPPGGRAGETVACSAGATYVVGCSQACGVGECEGSPQLRICDGTTPVAECAAGTSAQLESGTSFRSCSCRPRVVRCPASGRFTIAPVTDSDDICEWDLFQAPHREDGTEVCSPGQRVAVGCSEECGLGTCQAQSRLRVCDGNMTPEQCRAATTSSMWLAEGSPGACGGGDCPQATLTCPGSGAITVVTGTGANTVYACDWAMRNAGIGE